jgi:hypothetical protein
MGAWHRYRDRDEGHPDCSLRDGNVLE